MALCWIDLETTGLNAERDAILEIACIITDDALGEVARWSQVVHHPEAETLSSVDLTDEAAIERATDCTTIDPYVVRMHLTNGLWAESAASPVSLKTAEERLTHFILKCCATASDAVLGERRGPQLAGSTIFFDRAFLKHHMPKAHALLHYRNLDTTSLNELARRVWPAVHAARPSEVKGHRATADIEYSIAVAKYYAAALAPVPTTLPVAEHLP